MINMALEDQLSDVLRKMRYGRKISLKQLSESSGILTDQLRAFESGEAVPTPADRDRLGSALGFDSAVLEKLHLHPERTPSITPPVWIHPVKEDYHGMDVWCYVLEFPGATTTPEGKTRGILVDTGSVTHRLLDFLTSRKIDLQAILLTHGHEDHGGGFSHLPPHLPVYMNKADQELLFSHALEKPVTLPPEKARDLMVREGIQTFGVTPMAGHTKGSVAYRINQALFVGDGIFCGSAGKPWTPDDFGDELRSIRNLLDHNEPETLIFSGHGPFTTVGLEREMNPFYHCLPQA